MISTEDIGSCVSRVRGGDDGGLEQRWVSANHVEAGHPNPSESASACGNDMPFLENCLLRLRKGRADVGRVDCGGVDELTPYDTAKLVYRSDNDRISYATSSSDQG